jgi:hypothetical protein
MGLLDLPFEIQVKEVYLGKQFFFKRDRLAYDTMLAVCNYYLAVGTKSKGAPAGINGSVLILFEYSESILPA